MVTRGVAEINSAVSCVHLAIATSVKESVCAPRLGLCMGEWGKPSFTTEIGMQERTTTSSQQDIRFRRHGANLNGGLMVFRPRVADFFAGEAFLDRQLRLSKACESRSLTSILNEAQARHAQADALLLPPASPHRMGLPANARRSCWLQSLLRRLSPHQR